MTVLLCLMSQITPYVECHYAQCRGSPLEIADPAQFHWRLILFLHISSILVVSQFFSLLTPHFILAIQMQ